MEGGMRGLRQDSDNGPTELGSYGNDGFTDEQYDSGKRTKKKQAKSSKRIFEKEYPLRNVPKTAWNEGGDLRGGSRDELEGEGVEEDSTGRGRTVESSFDNSPYVPKETDNLETIVAGLERNIQLTVDSIGERDRARDRAHKTASSAHMEVERRKASLVEAIEEYSRQLHASVDGQLSLFESEEAVERLKEMLTAMRKTLEMRSQLNQSDSSALRDQLSKWLIAWNELKMQSELSFPFGLSKTTETPIDCTLLHQLFGVSMNSEAGNIEPTTADAKALTKNVDLRQHSAVLKFKYSMESQGLCGGIWTPSWKPRFDGKTSLDASKKQSQLTTLRTQKKIRESPQLMLAFSCRLQKDKRTCGITDLALTDEGQVLVLDKNNKVVKMFDSHGTFLKYFGKNDLRKPSRISRVGTKGHIAITDEATNRVLVFSEDGQFLSQLIALQRPVSHCQLTATRLAILEFATRSVVICDLSGMIISTFPTCLDCPSYIACTKSEHIIVTDWKSESFKIFDSTGCEIFSYCYSTSVESTRHVVEPYGVCADDGGVFIVADRKKREVVFYSEEGREVWCYDDAVNQIGVPFAVDCNGRGILAIGEYSGTVRLFKYKTDEGDDERTSDVTS